MHLREAIFLIRNLLLTGGDRRTLEMEKLLAENEDIKEVIKGAELTC